MRFLIALLLTLAALPAAAQSARDFPTPNLGERVPLMLQGCLNAQGQAVPQSAACASGAPVSGTVTSNQGQPNGGGASAWWVQWSGQSVAVSNFPATQPVSGTVTANQGTNPWTVAGTVNAAQSGAYTVTQGPAGAAAWKVDGSGVTQPVGNAGTFAVQNTAPTPAGVNTIGNAVPAPSAAAAVGVAPVSVQGAASNPVKGSAGNLYGFSFTEGATAGYFALLDLAAAPAAGAAIAPKECVPVPANGFVARRQDVPDRYANGIVIVSTSSCTTFTAVTPQIITGVAQ